MVHFRILCVFRGDSIVHGEKIKLIVRTRHNVQGARILQTLGSLDIHAHLALYQYFADSSNPSSLIMLMTMKRALGLGSWTLSQSLVVCFPHLPDYRVVDAHTVRRHDTEFGAVSRPLPGSCIQRQAAVFKWDAT